MDQQSVFEISFNFFRSKPVVVGPSPAQNSSDGGLLAFRQLDEELGLTYQFAECLDDRRHVGYIDHTFLDIDPFDDPTHGQQQLTFFHGYYNQYQYLPRAITCAENDMVLDVCLLYGCAHASLGAASDLEYVVRRLRAAWPGVRIHIRGDSGFAVPTVYETCEAIDTFYTIGLGMNSRLKKLSDSLLNEAVRRYEQTDQPQRLFCAFWYKADSWPAQRWVVVKCEANAQGTNRRAVVTNRPGAFVLPDAAYDAYADRCESENRNKELKCGLQADRLSDHRYFANLFRLYLHATAYNLLVRMRQLVVDPLPEVANANMPA